MGAPLSTLNDTIFINNTEITLSSSSTVTTKNSGSSQNTNIIPIFMSSTGQSTQVITHVIPPELFIDVFKNIPPQELFVVAQVCRLFRAILLSNQNIWRTSRLDFWPHLPLPPPDGMDEPAYIQLAMLEKGCQFCRKRKSGLKVYWAFQVRCCKDCLADMTISDFGLWSETSKELSSTNNDTPQIHPNIYSQLPYIAVNGFYGEETRYRTADVKMALAKYESNPAEYLDDLVDVLKAAKLQIFMAAVELRTAADDEARVHIIEERKDRIESIIEDFSNDINEDGLPLYEPDVLEKCPSYKEEISLLDQPFTLKDEISFRKKLKYEHENLASEIAIRFRQEDILREIWELIPSVEGCSIDCENPKHIEKRAKEKAQKSQPPSYIIPTTDCIFDCIDWCPSFTNPPFVNNDPRNNWSKEFLVYYLIPKLRQEAIEVQKNVRPLPYWTVKGAAEHKILSIAKVFRCRLCYDNNRVFDYRGVDAHLQNRIHSPGALDTMEIAEVDVMRALKAICKA
ncbi:11648_t:CDS:2 [Ambispora gerdemannii]|uniref:11648_t:CDS:1 n=1 Tax=Ambispora gerdemannii TaxID=144530 RepID=A0A9N9CZU2_9GLOM|nr:11648_t:CDS:2 [Ambispora gerdemannii]